MDMRKKVNHLHWQIIVTFLNVINTSFKQSGFVKG